MMRVPGILIVAIAMLLPSGQSCASSREMLLDVFAASPARGYGGTLVSRQRYVDGPYQGLPGLFYSAPPEKVIEEVNRKIRSIEETKGPGDSQAGFQYAALSSAHLAAGDYSAAVRAQMRAVEILVAASRNGHAPGSPREAEYRISAIRAQLGRLWLGLGQYRDARSEFQASLDVMVGQFGEEHATTAERQILLASALVAEGELEAGLAIASKALRTRARVFQRIQCFDLEGTTVVAAALDGLGDSDRAVAKLSSALTAMLAVSEPGNRNPNAYCRAYGHTHLGALQFGAGRYADALASHRRALAILDEATGSESIEAAFVHLAIAEVLESLGQPGAAVAEARSAQAIVRARLGPDHPRAAWGSAILARALISDGKPGPALEEADRALAALEGSYGPDHPRLARALLVLARDFDVTGTTARADFAERALVILERTFGAGHPATTPALVTASRSAASRGDAAGSLELAKRAFQASRGSTALPDRLAAEDSLFEALARNGENAAAIAAGKLAVNSMQSLRQAVRDLDTLSRRAFLERGAGRYRRLADLLVEEGRLAEASEVLAMLKEEEYHGFIRRTGAAESFPTKATLSDAESRAVARWEDASRGLVAAAVEYEVLRRRVLAQAAEPAEKARLSELETRLVEGRRAFDAALAQVNRELATLSPRRAAQIGEKGLENLRSFQGTLRELGPDVVLVNYVSLDRELLILLTTARSQVARRSLLPARELNRLAQRFRSLLLDRTSDPRPTAKLLYEKLIAPIAGDLEDARAQTLMVSLDGALRYLPLAALHDGDRYLVERYRLVVHSEAARSLLKKRPTAGLRVAGMGMSKEASGFSALPSVKQELGAIAKTPATPAGALPGKIALDEEFTSSALKSALGEGYPVIHLASHFAFRPGTFDDSFLLLGDGSRLTLRQFRDEDFDLNDVDLLTLSACDTALGGGQDGDGREVDGLGTLAQRQGARSVLATLWSVADDGTAILMADLYRRRSEQKLDKAESLRQSQLALLRGESRAPTGNPLTHPFYWAPFILMGNWR